MGLIFAATVTASALVMVPLVLVIGCSILGFGVYSYKVNANIHKAITDLHLNAIQNRAVVQRVNRIKNTNDYGLFGGTYSDFASWKAIELREIDEMHAAR